MQSSSRTFHDRVMCLILRGGTGTGGYVFQIQILSDNSSCQTHRDNALPAPDVRR